MKPDPRNRTISRILALLLCLAQALPAPALAGPVEIATTPMATSTTTTVRPNLMYVLDDSGSMAWDYMPDKALDFASAYGFNSSNCNGVYYNPNVTYSPPVDSTGAPLNATPTSFSAAYKNGYVTSAGTTDLSTGFKGGSGSGSSGNVMTAGPAFYYTYTGAQTTPALQNYFDTNSLFYRECNSAIGSTPGSGVFTKTKLAITPTTTITISAPGAGGAATITVNSNGSRSKFDQVTVTYGGNTYQIMNATTASSSRSSTIAAAIAAGINACTTGNTGICNVSPAGTVAAPAFSATSSGAVVTLSGPAAAAGATLNARVSSGSATFTKTDFPPLNGTDVSSITVGGVQLLAATANGGTRSALASALVTQINLRTAISGYSAVSASNVVTITGPTSASLLLPAITSAANPSSGTAMTLVTEAFPESTPAKLQNFANWYSYYSHRMLMMKTGSGLAFNNVTDKYRVGFLTMNNNVSPGIVEANTFNTAQRASFFSKLYASIPNNSTPLREILSRVGQYYAHKFGAVTTYKATITVGGSGATSVDSILVGTTETMDDATPSSSTTADLAQQIANQINAPQVTDYGASASGNVVTILGPASANGVTPVVSSDGGGMTFTRTAFTGTTVTTTLNGITPADPIQYSCQQNFTILSTDGYWNGPNTYNLTGGPVGQVDGTAQRPYNDGATPDNKTTTTYTRHVYSTSGSRIGGSGSNCTSPKLRGLDQLQTETCDVITVAGVAGAETCGVGWTDTGSKVYVSPYDSTSGSCVTTPVVPSPNPSVRQVSGTPVVTLTNPGVANTLADVALYYYQTDLRDNNLGNCTGALGTSVCENNVFISGTDNQTQQHMTTFTLGLGVRGRMIYSSSYLTDSSGDFYSVKLGLTANAGPSTIAVSGTGSTTVSGITVNGVQLMSGTSVASTDPATVAANVATKITQNSFTATATGSVVNIFGPASAAGFTPVITKSGTMVLTGAAGTPTCSWQANGTSCNWPVPTAGSPETTDDLWHAAVNGRGAYFSASDPETLAAGLQNALTSISSKVGAAAAAATSTLNPVAGNNQAFVASYTTLSWTGNLEARGINTDTGVVNENANWCVENVAAGNCTAPGVITADTSGDTTAYFCTTANQVTCPGGTLSGGNCNIPIATACTGTMNAKVADSSDTRTIYTAAHNSTVSDVPLASGGTAIANGSALVNFNTAFRSVNPGYFDSTLLAGLSQWPTDGSADSIYFRANAPGDNLLKYLRGQRGHEIARTSVLNVDQFYRARDRVLGDALESQPAFIGAPIFSYPYPGYAQFLAPFDASTNPTGQGNRPGTVYMGTNDGMMHAFAADTGIERWSYVPSMVIPNMWKLADNLYSDKHTNYVNGSPVTTDICAANCANAYNASTPSTNPVWKTILVAGLNGGGRGYFALDITDPSAPALLWEFTTSTGIGKVTDDDLGYTFGQPVVTRRADGKWVVLVTSGYDNGTDSAAKVSGSFVANSPAGSGVGYLYVLDAATGAKLAKISTGVGTAANPSGLAKIAGFNAESGGNKVSYVYGGDLLGNLWRFDINASTAAVVGTGSAMKFATLFSDTAGTLPQPIMTTPILGVILGKRVIFIGTGKYLEVPDLSTNQKQTQYAIKDDDATTTYVNPRTTLVQQFLINNPDGTGTRLAAASAGATTTGANTVDFGVGRGWFVDLPDDRERVNIDAKLVLGTLIVPSIVPSATTCSPGGNGWLNFLDYKTGGAVTLQPGLAGVRYDATIVGVNVLFIGGNPVVEVVTSTNPTPDKDPNVQFKATAASFSGKRVLWRELVPTD